MTAMPVHLIRNDEPEHKPGAVQKVARLHEKAVQQVTESRPKRARKAQVRRASKVTTRVMHPALKMAHDLGIEAERIQVTAEPPFWGAIIHNDGSWRG